PWLTAAAPIRFPRLDDLFLPLDGERPNAAKLGIGPDSRKQRVVVHGRIGEKVSFYRRAKQLQRHFVEAAECRVARPVVPGLRIPSCEKRRQSGSPLLGGGRRGARQTYLHHLGRPASRLRREL